MCSRAPDRAVYEGRWCDLIGQLECGLEVLMGWEPHARTNGLSRSLYFEVADACGPYLVAWSPQLKNHNSHIETLKRQRLKNQFKITMIFDREC